MSLRSQDASRPEEAEFESLIANLFRRAGWKVVQKPAGRDLGADLVVDSGERRYVVELKRSSEGRRDRLIPLLSQAILQAEAVKRRLSESAVSVAIVAAPRIPGSVAEELKRFAGQHAPDVAVGIVDLEGFRAFQGFGLERFNAERSVRSSLRLLSQSRLPLYLFSDLNQWMLKVLLAPKISASYLSAPRGQYQNAAQLARAADVSVMSASRFVRQLSKEGFLDGRQGHLALVRLEELLERWRGVSRHPARQLSARWIIRGGNNQFRSAVESYASQMRANPLKPKRSREPRGMSSLPRICVGLFGAGEMLGVGFVRGVAPYVYLERLDAGALTQLGLSLEGAERSPDIQILIPENRESLFRPVVWHAGVPVSDIIQIWLDVSNHPARGKEQAQQIWRKVLRPALQGEGHERSSRP